MPLTPEQVLNKHFQTTQFRRGYEERDVDDFLDEIVAEMRSLIEQREDFLKQLNDCRASRNQPAVRGGDAGGQSSSRSDDEGKLASVSARLEDAERAFKAASDRAAKASADAEEAENQARERIERAQADAGQAASAASQEHPESGATAEQSASVASADHSADQRQIDDAEATLASLNEQIAQAHEALAGAKATHPEADAVTEGPVAPVGVVDTAPVAAPAKPDAAGVIALAQRLHDEYVAAGEARRDELISEAEDRHLELITEAEERHAQLLATGQAKFDELAGSGQQQHESAVREAQELIAQANAERDEMIGAATTERDRMIAEATKARDEMLTAARERSTGMVAEAQQKRASVLAQLEADKSALGRTIDELRGFERSYRGNLRTYIEGQLHDLEGHQQEPAAAGEASAEAEQSQPVTSE